MKTTRTRRIVTGLFLALLCGSFAAAQLSVKDVVSLKKMGFSDAEILAEAARSGAALNLSEADLAQLKAAGASDALIRGLRNPPRNLSLDDVTAMVRAGRPSGQIIEAIAAAPRKPAPTAAQALELQRQKVPAAVILALRAKPLGPDELRTLAEERTDPVVFDQLGKLLGFVPTDLSAAAAMELTRAGVPAETVRALKAAAAVPVQQEAAPNPPQKNQPDPKPEAPLVEPPKLVPELIGTWEGTGKFGMMSAHCTMTFTGEGEYSLNVQGYLQQGRWSVVHGNLVLDPMDGQEEAERYEIRGDTLTIKSAAGVLILRRIR